MMVTFSNGNHFLTMTDKSQRGNGAKQRSSKRPQSQTGTLTKPMKIKHAQQKVVLDWPAGLAFFFLKLKHLDTEGSYSGDRSLSGR